jgi:prevent-host-death family protein
VPQHVSNLGQLLLGQRDLRRVPAEPTGGAARPTTRLVAGLIFRYKSAMKTVALSEAKDKLSSLVYEAERTHEIIRITKHGYGAAVLMSADDLESLHETLHVLSTPGAVDELRQADAGAAAGHVVTGEELRRRHGLEAR